MTNPNQFGPVIGEYRDEDIHEWFTDHKGIKFQYIEIAKEDRYGGINLDQLRTDEVVVSPGLIYKRETTK